MRINYGPGLQQLGQTVSNIGDAFAQVNVQRQQQQATANENLFQANSQRAKITIQGYMQQLLNEANDKLYSEDFDLDSAGVDLSNRVYDYFESSSGQWFKDDESKGRFMAEVLDPVVGTMRYQIEETAHTVKNQMADETAKNNATEALLSLQRGADPDAVYDIVRKSIQIRNNAQAYSPTQLAALTASYDRQYNTEVARAGITNLVNSGLFTGEDILNAVDALNDPSKIKADAEWGLRAQAIVDKLKTSDGLTPFTNDELENLRSVAKSLMVARKEERVQIVTEHLQTLQAQVDKTVEKDPDRLTLTMVDAWIDADPVLKENKNGAAYTGIKHLRDMAKDTEDNVMMSTLTLSVNESGMAGYFTTEDQQAPLIGNSRFKSWDQVEQGIPAAFRTENRAYFHSETSYKVAEAAYIEQAKGVFQQLVMQALFDEYDTEIADGTKVFDKESIDNDSRFDLLGKELAETARSAVYNELDRTELTVESQQSGMYNMLLPVAINTYMSTDDRKRTLSRYIGQISDKQYDQLYQLIDRTPTVESYKTDIAQIDQYVQDILGKKPDKMDANETARYNRIAGIIKQAYNGYLAEHVDDATPESVAAWIQNNLSTDADYKRFLLHGVGDEGSWVLGKDGSDFISMIQDGRYDKDIWPISFGKAAEYTDSLLQGRLGLSPSDTLAMSTNSGMVYQITASQHPVLAEIYGDEAASVSIGVRFMVDDKRRPYPVYSVQLADGSHELFTLPDEMPKDVEPPIEASNMGMQTEGVINDVLINAGYNFGKKIMDQKEGGGADDISSAAPSVKKPDTAVVQQLSNTSVTPEEDAARMDRMNAQIKMNATPLVPKVTPAEDAARMSRTNAQATLNVKAQQKADDEQVVSELSSGLKTILRARLAAWMKNNPGALPSKEAVGSQITNIEQRHIDAMYRMILREEGKL
jgi:hypothetical protein